MASTRHPVRPETRLSQRRTYVLDTSVLLADPRALIRFAEHEVVLPVVVITELEAKRHHPELGYFARQALRMLDDLRIQHGRLDAPIPVGSSGGTLRVELNHADPAVLPAGFRLGDNDTRILAVARSLAADGRHVTLVSKDLPMRVKASAVGLEAEEYRAGEPRSTVGWTGMAELEVSAEAMASLYAEQAARPRRPLVSCPATPGWCCCRRAGAALGPGHARQAASGWCAATGTRSACTGAAPSSGSRSTCCSTPRSGSSRSAAGPAPASRRSRCAPGSRRCWNAASTARWWCSVRSTRSAARSSATCPAPRPRR